jgi:hypothetical protein
MTRLPLLGLVAISAFLSCGPQDANWSDEELLSDDEALADCLSSGTEVKINAALVGVGAEAVLCPGAVFNLSAPVRFTAANQKLSTKGLPVGSTRALLRLTSASLTTAVDGANRSGISIQNIQVEGNRGALGYLQGKALIVIGGSASDQVVRNVAARNTRSWSTIHVFEGPVANNTPTCQRATITGNTIGPAGFPDGTWADGISLACGNSVVTNNQIHDATDGAIVIFGAPGSLIQNNTIIAATRTLLGGINLVDFAPVNGNYTGTRVLNNVIEARGAFIKVGIAMGPAVWMCSSNLVYGATVSGNGLKGIHFGYGYAVNGVSGFSITGNWDQARHVGLPKAGCGGGAPAAPAGFQVQTAPGSSLQSEFRSASLGYLLGVTEPAILGVLKPATGCGSISADQGLVPGQTFRSCDGRFGLVLQWDGNVVLYQGSTPLWATNTVGKSTAQVIVQGDGNVVVYDAKGSALAATNTAGHPGAWLAVQNDGNLVVYGPTGAALWASNTGGR